jgi:hypothetical protein
MQIEVGKTYRTRDGGTATVMFFEPNHYDYRFGGIIEYKNKSECCSESWTDNGSASIIHVSPTDLIEEIEPPAPQAHKTTNHDR